MSGRSPKARPRCIAWVAMSRNLTNPSAKAQRLTSRWTKRQSEGMIAHKFTGLRVGLWHNWSLFEGFMSSLAHALVMWTRRRERSGERNGIMWVRSTCEWREAAERADADYSRSSTNSSISWHQTKFSRATKFRNGRRKRAKNEQCSLISVPSSASLWRLDESSNGKRGTFLSWLFLNHIEVTWSDPCGGLSEFASTVTI